MGVFKLGNSEINSISLIEPYESIQFDVEPVNDYIEEPWVRPSEWLDLPPIISGVQQIAGLMLVPSGAPVEVGFKIYGPMTSYLVYPTYSPIDWGDGTTTVATGTTSSIPYNYHEYNFDDLDPDTEVYHNGELCRQAVFTVDGSASGFYYLDLTRMNGSYYNDDPFNYQTYTQKGRLVDVQIEAETLRLASYVVPSIEHMYLRAEYVDLYQRFQGMKELRVLELYSGVQVGTNADRIFNGCYKLQELPFFDTSQVTNFYQFANSCRAITGVPPYDTSNVTRFDSAFGNCTSLKDIPRLDYSNSTVFNGTFSNCDSLTHIESGVLDTSSCTSAQTMFYSCDNLVSLPPDLDMSNCTNIDRMCQYNTSLRNVPPIDLSSCIYATGVFDGCLSLKKVRFTGNPANVTTFRNLFQTCRNLRSVEMENADNTSATDFGGMFNGCIRLQKFPRLNLTSGTYLRSMFAACNSIKNIETLDVPNATNLGYMFSNCINLTNHGGFTPFNNKITTAERMFSACYRLSNFPSGLFVDYNSCPNSTNYMFQYNYLIKSLPDLNLSGISNISYYMFNSMSPESMGSVVLGPIADRIFNGFTNIYSIRPPEGQDYIDASVCDNLNDCFSTCSNLSYIPISGIRTSTSFRSCNLGSGIITDIFNMLQTVSSATINLQYNYGAYRLHPDTIAIATSKGWTVTT